MNTCKFMCHSGLICSLCQRARSQIVSGTDSSTGSWSPPSFSLQSTGTSEQSNTWRTISSIKKYAIRWFVSMLEQSLGSSLRLTCIDSFKIFIYTFSLSFPLSTFLFLLGPVQATNTCTVRGETGARVGQGQSELHFGHSKVWDLQMEPVRLWETAITTEIHYLKKRHEKYFTLSVKTRSS